jgi:hypothetical protein
MYCSSASQTAHNYGVLAAMDRDSEIRLAIQTALGKYPGHYHSIPAVVNIATHSLIDSMSAYTTVAMEVDRWIIEAISDGFLHLNPGKGIMLMTDHQQLPLSPPIQKLSNQTMEPAVNDYVCPHCKNDRVSRNEITCWKCGGKL